MSASSVHSEPPAASEAACSTHRERRRGDPRTRWVAAYGIRAPPRVALIELDSLDQDPVDAARLAVFMYPHIEQAAETKTTPGISRFVRSNDADAPSLTKRFLPAIATTIVTTKMIKTRR